MSDEHTDQLGSSYSYHPQHPNAYQSHTTPPQHDVVESSDVFGKTNRHTDRHTIVDMSLRSVRFLVLASIGLGAAFTYATATNTKLVLTKVVSETTDMTTFHDDVNVELSGYNALFGTIMFICSKVFEVYMETLIFPTLHTYLHNCSLFPGDQPQRVHSKIKANAIFWSLKAVLIFMNVGFASLYVGQSTVKTESASRRLAVSEMMDAFAPSGLGSSSSWGLGASAEASETDVLNTILRTAVTGSTKLFDHSDRVGGTGCQSDPSLLSVSDVDTTSVAFGFPSHDWSAGVLRHGANPTFSIQFTLQEFEEEQAELEKQAASDSRSLLPTANELLVQGIEVLRNSLGERSLSPAKQQFVEARSLKRLVDQVVGGLNASLSIDASILGLGLAAYELTEDVSLVSMTIDVPVTSGNGAVLCGTTGCIYSHTLDTRLKPEISIMPYRTDANCLSPSRCEAEENAAFLYGLGRSVRDADSKSETPREFLSLSFAKMVWRASPLHVRHQAECVDGHCLGLSVPLSSTNGIVLVGREALPSDHLHASPANPLRLVALSPVAIPAERGAYATWDRVANASPRASGACSSSLVDAYLQHLDANKLFIEKPMQAMYTSALLYLLQNGVLTEYADATSRRLALAASGATESRVDIEVAIPTTSSLATFAGCAIMVLLTVFVIYFPTDRVKLSPNTTAAAQYVQILTDDLYPDIVHKKRLRFVNGDGLLFNEYVVDSIVLHAKRNEKKKIYLHKEEAYPNFVYKKRFLIGKTGEEIKFGEFAVESVGLHHKMEEDEQIYL